jgi:hypothetical protein
MLVARQNNVPALSTLPNGVFLLGLQTKIVYAFLICFPSTYPTINDPH